jgi:hypothetical protein
LRRLWLYNDLLGRKVRSRDYAAITLKGNFKIRKQGAWSKRPHEEWQAALQQAVASYTTHPGDHRRAKRTVVAVTNWRGSLAREFIEDCRSELQLLAGMARTN